MYSDSNEANKDNRNLSFIMYPSFKMSIQYNPLVFVFVDALCSSQQFSVMSGHFPVCLNLTSTNSG